MKEALTKIFASGSQSVETVDIKNFFFSRFSFFTFHFSLLLFVFCSIAAAQEEQFEETAPPPMKIISKEEKSILDAETNISDRTKLSLAMMETRLKKAEDNRTRESFAELFGELGSFHALVDEALVFLNKHDDGRNGKVLNNFKRLELNLRQFIPRVELIRRELPAKYESYVRDLIKNLRAARTRAVEPFFGDSVVSAEKKVN